MLGTASPRRKDGKNLVLDDITEKELPHLKTIDVIVNDSWSQHSEEVGASHCVCQSEFRNSDMAEINDHTLTEDPDGCSEVQVQDETTDVELPSSKDAENDVIVRGSSLSGAEEASTTQRMKQPDFSHLPELVWVNVFQKLDVSDRFRLSQMNWFLYSLFHDGAVWRKATITFDKALVHGYFFLARYKLRLSEQEKKLARKFGHFYRDVTLRMLGRPEEMEDDTRQILARLQQTWRLESLTLDIGDREFDSRYRGEETVSLSLLSEVVAMLKTSTALRTLHVLHWPQSYLVHKENFQISQVLSAAECLKLRSLRLPRTSENAIATVTAPRDLAVQVLTKFRCLRHVYVTSDMLSEALLDSVAVSGLAGIRTMSVEIAGFWSTGFLDHLLTPLPWYKLTACNPGLEVTMTISADIPEFAFARFFEPDIPLVAITFDINCHCYRKAFQLMHQYSETLRSFRCFSHPQDCELELLDMVRVCGRLQHLHFHGDISDYNVLKVAEAGGRRWGQFSFVWRSIEKTTQRPTPFNLVSRAQQEETGTTKTEEEVKAEFCQQVSKRLGTSWEPLVL